MNACNRVRKVRIRSENKYKKNMCKVKNKGSKNKTSFLWNYIHSRRILKWNVLATLMYVLKGLVQTQA